MAARAHVWLRQLIFWSALAVLLWGVFRPQSPPSLFVHSDVSMHLLALFGFGCIAYWAFAQSGHRWMWWGLLVFAVLLELSQGYVQVRRQFDLWDMLANASGVLLAWWSSWLFERWWRRPLVEVTE